MNTNFLYDKMDYYSILEYLNKQAELFSYGDWTDFSDADIGTVLLKLMAMNADTTNYQVEKGVSELYLDTAIERVNAVALCKLIGYEPRHYISSTVDITASYSGVDIDGLKVPAYSSFGDSTGSLKFYTLEDTPISSGLNKIKAYQGNIVFKSYSYEDIDNNGRLILSDYEIGTNTLRVSQAGLKFEKVDNALYGEGESCFSVHINLDNKLYIQFPTYYSTIMSNTTPIDIVYLLSDGASGRIGSGVITGTMTLSNGENISFINEVQSEGGYNPETVEEIRREAPAYASTMNTLVTLNDFRILAKDFDGIADAVALDYNYPESGLIQPTDDTVNDAYKVNLYILPESADSIYKPEEIPDIDQMTLLTDDDFNIEPVTGTYSFDYDTTDGYFYNTNAKTDGTSAMLAMTPKTAWKKMLIKYETETEESYDYLYIDINGENKAKVSGVKEGEFLLEDVIDTNNFVFTYIKDDNSYYGNDLVKIKIYATNEDGSTVYTDEYLDEIKTYVASVKKKKPAGIQINYMNADIIKPQLVIKVYMDKDDLRYSSAGISVATYIESKYSRENHKIGEPIYQSHISRDILSKFDYIQYLEIISLEGAEDGAIKPNNKEYIELLTENTTVKVVPYER